MATNLQSNPIVITGSVTGYKAQTASALGTLRTLIVERILWVNPPASSSISIGDPISGEILWTRQTGATNTTNQASPDIDENWTSNPRIWQDFALDIFPGGTLYIYCR